MELLKKYFQNIIDLKNAIKVQNSTFFFKTARQMENTLGIISKRSGLPCKMQKIFKGSHYTVKNFHMVKYCQIF